MRDAAARKGTVGGSELERVSWMMREIGRTAEAWLKRRRTWLDLFALCVLAIASMGYRALGLGTAGLWFAAFVVLAIVVLALLAARGSSGKP